jgi:hypothetical protein
MPKPMKVHYDTEFLETPGGAIMPISIGMVREDGKEYYAVYNDMDTLAVARNEWLMENVMSSIRHFQFTSHLTGTGQPVRDFELTDKDSKPKSLIRGEILDFLSDIWPDFWAWYGAYDHVVLCQTFGRMIDLPAKFPMFTSDLKQLNKLAGNPDMPQQPAGKHNALDDARFNVVRYNFLMDEIKRKDVARISGILDRSHAG